MTASQQSLAAAMRKYASECSASLDPFEEPHVDTDDTVAMQSWLQRVEHVMTTHRSPFIAAEVLLTELDEYARNYLHHPDRLFVATALPVLHHCLPALTPEHRDVIDAAVRELVPAIAFTRVRPAVLSPTGTEVARRVPYAECFWRVYDIYAKHRRALATGARRMEVEAAVMDRVVLSLDRMWLKMCFLSWRVYCRQIREKKLLFKKLAHRGMAGHIVPRYIRAWRQHAHALMLRSKIARSSEVARELEALYPQEQHAKSLNERATEEVREKMRLLNAETGRCDQATAKLEVLRALHRECELSLQAHWDTWKSCMTTLFGDSHPISRALEEDYSNRVTYEQNITDTAQLLARRARARTGLVGLKQIQTCLQSRGYLADADAAGDAAPDAAAAPVSRLGTRYVKAPAAAASVDVTMDALRAACAPVVSPLRLADLMRGNQVQLNVVLSFLSCMYSGGHCSLFWPPRTTRQALDETEVSCTLAASTASALGHSAASSTSAVSRSGADRASSAKAGGNPLDGVQRRGGSRAALVEAPPADLGSRMIRDVVEGMSRAHVYCEGTDRHLLAIRRCMESGAESGVQEYLGSLFARFSTMGLPLDREKVEQALSTLVRPSEAPIVRALYPSQGVRSFTEFSEYLTKIAELSSHSLLSIGERLENDYPWSPQEELLYVFHTTDDIRQLLRDSSDYVNRLADWTKDEAHPERLSRDRVMLLLCTKLGLTEEHAEEVWTHACTEPETVGKEDMDRVLYLASALLEPSPFIPPAEKLAIVLDRCVPFLLNL